MKTLLALVKLFFAAMAVAAVGAAMPADYEVRILGKSGCYNKNGTKRMSSARFCHNCRRADGEQVRWHFQVFCEGKPTAKELHVSRACKRSILEEGEMSAWMYEQANELMEDNLQILSGVRDCNFGGWKK